MWTLGLCRRNSYSGKLYFKFSVLFLCSAYKTCFHVAVGLHNAQSHEEIENLPDFFPFFTVIIISSRLQ
jgi:hypothetical protein